MYLIFQPNTKESKLLKLLGSAATLGSAEGNVLTVEGAAPFHLGLFYIDGAWFADDLSGRGFLLDGQSVTKAQLRVGNILKLSDVVLLVVNDELHVAEEAAAAVHQSSAVKAPSVTAEPVEDGLKSSFEEIREGTQIAVSAGTAAPPYRLHLQIPNTISLHLKNTLILPRVWL